MDPRWLFWAAAAAISCHLAAPVGAFSRGAGPASCRTMSPAHIRVRPQDPRRSLVTVRASARSYRPGQLVTVTVRSSRDFMGFLLQARRGEESGAGAADKGTVPAGGSWPRAPPGTHALRCLSEGDTLTHSDKQPKRNLSFAWRAPDAPAGDVRFYITVVQSYFVYWSGIKSAVVRDGSPGPWTGEESTKAAFGLTGEQFPAFSAAFRHREDAGGALKPAGKRRWLNSSLDSGPASEESDGPRPPVAPLPLQTSAPPYPSSSSESRRPGKDEQRETAPAWTPTPAEGPENAVASDPAPAWQKARGALSSSRAILRSVGVFPTLLAKPEDKALGALHTKRTAPPPSLQPTAPLPLQSSVSRQKSNALAVTAKQSDATFWAFLSGGDAPSLAASSPSALCVTPASGPAGSPATSPRPGPSRGAPRGSGDETPPPGPSPGRTRAARSRPEPSANSDRRLRSDFAGGRRREPGARLPSSPRGSPGEESQTAAGRSSRELATLLGGAAGLGMALAAALRYACKRSCGKRTRVTLSERERHYGRGERATVHVQECGDLVRVRRIRENSVVLLAEYDVLAAPGD
ncbi:uncharacterized protein LOC144066132 [Stigmatopora argus]